jgi:hypothetical protein
MIHVVNVRGSASYASRIDIWDANNQNVKISLDGNPANANYFNGGNVGIGETSPARKLHVKDSNKQVARIESTAVSNLKVDVCVNNGTPNAVITALRGSLCVDITNAKLYINNSGTNPGDSGTSWVLV